MSLNDIRYTYIETNESLATFAEAHQTVEWLGFDSEFVGEKRFHTLICLFQVSSVNGYFLIDPLSISDLSPLFSLLENENILKITHAGDNDFRLLYQQFQVLPKNVFDTQLAAGFIGYKYPIAFGKLVEREVNVSLPKSYTVTDWEKRPFSKQQLDYAISDVAFLYDLYKILDARLTKMNRQTWANEEFTNALSQEQLEKDPDKEILNSDLIRGLPKKQQIMLIRLLRWRTAEAMRKNHSKDMVLPSKLISTIIRSIPSGRKALIANRRVPEHVVRPHFDLFEQMYSEKPLVEELAMLAQIPPDRMENPQQDMMMEMLVLIMKYKCTEQNIPYNLLLSGSSIRRMKTDGNFTDKTMINGWRKTFLGPKFIEWLKNRQYLTMQLEDDRVEIKMQMPESTQD